MVETIAQAKINLYSLLLKKKVLTDSEINIAYELSKDKDIQDVLDK